jgi:hypothetical protein
MPHHITSPNLIDDLTTPHHVTPAQLAAIAHRQIQQWEPTAEEREEIGRELYARVFTRARVQPMAWIVKAACSEAPDAARHVLQTVAAHASQQLRRGVEHDETATPTGRAVAERMIAQTLAAVVTEVLQLYSTTPENFRVIPPLTRQQQQEDDRRARLAHWTTPGPSARILPTDSAGFSITTETPVERLQT